MTERERQQWREMMPILVACAIVAVVLGAFWAGYSTGRHVAYNHRNAGSPETRSVAQ